MIRSTFRGWEFMPPRLKNDILSNFYRPCYSAHERAPPLKQREKNPKNAILTNHPHSFTRSKPDLQNTLPSASSQPKKSRPDLQAEPTGLLTTVVPGVLAGITHDLRVRAHDARAILCPVLHAGSRGRTCSGRARPSVSVGRVRLCANPVCLVLVPVESSLDLCATGCLFRIYPHVLEMLRVHAYAFPCPCPCQTRGRGDLS